MTRPRPNLQKSDWVRFHLQNQRTVLEGFVLEISEDGNWIKIGKSPDSMENLWYAASAVALLDHRVAGAPS